MVAASFNNECLWLVTIHHKTLALSEELQKPQKFSSSNALLCMVIYFLYSMQNSSIEIHPQKFEINLNIL